MKIHRECLKKQKMNEKIYEDFKINQPSKIGFHADKPNNNPFLLMKYKSQGKNINGVDIDEKLDNDMQKTVLTDEINDKLKTVTQVPKDKWQFPQTSNQQIGWYAQVITPLFRTSRTAASLSTSARAATRPTTPTTTTR